MMHDGDRGADEGRLDLVPMIDCIMLLMIFFVMTTRFSTEEKTIPSLLPTDRGPVGVAGPKDIRTVDICIYPAGPRMVRGLQPSQYAAEHQRLMAGSPMHDPVGSQVKDRVIEAVSMRVGQRDPITIDGRLLAGNGGPDMVREVERIHRYLAEELELFEITDEPRNRQRDVVIHAFTALPWKCALLAYDAVRSYESGKSAAAAWTGDPRELEAARAVNFAPPRIRHLGPLALGDELFEIINRK